MSHRIPSPIRLPVRVVSSASNTALLTDGILDIQGTGARTVTLPDATKCEGLILVLKDGLGNALTNTITIDTSNSQTIDGVFVSLLSVGWDSVTVYSDGANWKTLAALA